MNGILHVINQLGEAHAQALSVIAEQSMQIEKLKAALEEKERSN